MRNAWTRLVELAAAVCCVLGGISARGETTLGHRYEIVPWTQGWTAAKAPLTLAMRAASPRFPDWGGR